MKRIAIWLARLYPRWWRSRYGEELDALLEDTNLTLLDVFGVVRSALEMRMKPIAAPRLLDMSCRDLPSGYELESSVELPLENGSTMVLRSFLRQIDLGDSYVTLTHSSRGSGPAQTILICGKKAK